MSIDITGHIHVSVSVPFERFILWGSLRKIPAFRLFGHGIHIATAPEDVHNLYFSESHFGKAHYPD